jgi:transcriptional regulator GlxA family with amidase domain
MCESIENYAKQYASKERKEGIAEGELKTYINLIKDNILTIEEVADRLNMSVDQLQEYMK